MANTLIKATKIVEAANLLLQREIVLPRTTWMQSSSDFVGAFGDTVTLKVPAVLDARSRTMRSSTALVADDLTETSVDVTLDTHLYSLLNITDEQLTLDIRDFARTVIAPQIHSIVEGYEDVIAAALAAANVDVDSDVTFTVGTDEAYDFAVDLRKILNDANVARSNRFLVLGSELEAAFLKSDKLSNANQAGTDDALREAIIGRVAGWTIIGSNAVAADAGYGYHRTAIASQNVAPAVPAGAADGARRSDEGVSLRYLRDYNPTNSTGPVDRSLVDAFVGATSVEDGLADVDGGGTDNDVANVRLIKITAA